MPAEMLTELVAATQDYAAAQAKSAVAASRTQRDTAEKNTARTRLKAVARRVVGTIEQLGVSDGQRADLGLRVRRHWSRVPVPAARAYVTAEQTVSRRVRVRVGDLDHSARGLPPRVGGVQVFCATREEAAAGRWTFVALKTRAVFELDFEELPGDVVYLAASFCNPRGDAGARSQPTSVWLPPAVHACAA